MDWSITIFYFNDHLQDAHTGRLPQDCGVEAEQVDEKENQILHLCDLAEVTKEIISLRINNGSSGANLSTNALTFVSVAGQVLQDTCDYVSQLYIIHKTWFTNWSW